MKTKLLFLTFFLAPCSQAASDKPNNYSLSEQEQDFKKDIGRGSLVIARKFNGDDIPENTHVLRYCKYAYQLNNKKIEECYDSNQWFLSLKYINRFKRDIDYLDRSRPNFGCDYPNLTLLFVSVPDMKELKYIFKSKVPFINGVSYNPDSVLPQLQALSLIGQSCALHLSTEQPQNRNTLLYLQTASWMVTLLPTLTSIVSKPHISKTTYYTQLLSLLSQSYVIGHCTYSSFGSNSMLPPLGDHKNKPINDIVQILPLVCQSISLFSKIKSYRPKDKAFKEGLELCKERREKLRNLIKFADFRVSISCLCNAERFDIIFKDPTLSNLRYPQSICGLILEFSDFPLQEDTLVDHEDEAHPTLLELNKVGYQGVSTSSSLSLNKKNALFGVVSIGIASAYNYFSKKK